MELKNIKSYNRYKTKSAVFGKTSTDSCLLLPVFQKSEANLFVEINSVVRKNKKAKHSPTKLRKIEASLEKKEQKFTKAHQRKETKGYQRYN